MIIALDYDQTFTRDPNMWGVFLELAYAMGHEVFIVTMRESASSAESIEEKVADYTHSGVLYTNRRAKIDDLRERGVEVDIWIDDSPHHEVAQLKKQNAWLKTRLRKVIEKKRGQHDPIR